MQKMVKSGRRIFPLIWAAVEVVLVLAGIILKNRYFAAGCLFWGVVLFLFYLIRPGARLHALPIKDAGKKERGIYAAVLILLAFLCLFPMGLNPIWNGEEPQWRNQYEEFTENILEGRIYFDYEIDPVLAEMENPYDPAARKEAGASYHWDHAFYNGRYYMYFGVVPVFLLFLPFRVLTGHALTTFHATQIFVLFILTGIFLLLWQLARRFFREISFYTVLALAAAGSLLSIWYSINCPALYCTAITGGICMEIWSLWFYLRAVYFEEKERRQVLFTFFGALFGALAFGCRPPVAMANLLALPLFVIYLRKKKEKGELRVSLLLKILLAILPYVIIGALIMLYNKARFGSPFEFGQAYQITSADQHLYSIGSKGWNLKEDLKAILGNFFSFNGIRSAFPFIKRNGAFLNFPVLLTCFLAFWKPAAAKLRRRNMLVFTVCILLTTVLITAVDAHWAPQLSERYHMDIYYLLVLAGFLGAASFGSVLGEAGRRRFSFVICILAVLAAAACFLLLVEPRTGEKNLTWYYPELFEKIKRVLSVGLYRG